MLTLLLVVLMVDTAFTENIDCTDNRLCNCTVEEKLMRCYGNNTMNTIPPLNSIIEALVITYGNFQFVSKDTFTKVGNSSLMLLKMTNCNIRKLSPDAFFHLQKLEVINLSENIELNVSFVAAALHSLANSTSLKNVTFDRMRWKDLPDDMFRGLENTNVSVINLSHNFLTSIKGSIFSNISSLSILNLGWTGLDNPGSNFSGLSQIKTLILKGTWFNRFPNFCDIDNRTTVPSLEQLILDDSKINSIGNVIRCLNNLKVLHLNGLSLRIIYPNTFVELISLQELYLQNLGSQFRKVTVAALHSRTLQVLKFSVNEKKFLTDTNNENFNASKLFSFCPNLKTLDLSKNRIILNPMTWEKMFKPLKMLQTLSLQDTKISKIPNFGDALRNLKSLDLSYNKIPSWRDEKPFRNFRKLQKLNMRMNLVSVINEKSFPANWTNGSGTLRTLYLAGNPFSCTCDISWFRNWMDTTERKNITTDSNKWNCSVSNESLEKYRPNKTFECLMPYIITSVLVFVFILLVAFICFVFRLRIKLAWYKCTTRKKDYIEIRDKNVLYDCFIAYSYKDLWWIQKHAIPQMEEFNNLTICIRDRDFRLGTVFSNALITNIRSSKSIILLLSDNFAKDKWCKFQLDIANFINIYENDPVTVIPVMLYNEVEFKNMNESLYQIIKRGDFVQWHHDGPAQELFWRTIVNRIPKCVISRETSLYDDSVHTLDSGIQT